MRLLDKLKERQKQRKDKCYEEHKDSQGKCYGLLGGDRSTDYYAECCVGCKYLTIYLPKEG